MRRNIPVCLYGGNCLYTKPYRSSINEQHSTNESGTCTITELPESFVLKGFIVGLNKVFKISVCVCVYIPAQLGLGGCSLQYHPLLVPLQLQLLQTQP